MADKFVYKFPATSNGDEQRQLVEKMEVVRSII